MVRSILSLLATLLSLYIGVLVLMYFTQSRQIYFPIRDHSATPADAGFSYEDVSLLTEDGVRLHGWFVPASEARGVLLFFHGNAGNISHRLDSIRIFHDLGLSVFIIDYRGYGQSEGKTTEAGTYLDAQAAWRHLREERDIPSERIVVFGRSLGAAVAAWLAARERPAAVILESPFISAAELAADLLPWLPARYLVRFEYDTRSLVGSLRAPLLVIHSRDDEIIPFRHGEAVLAAAPEPRAFLAIQGGHNDGFLRSGSDYIAGLNRFLTCCL